MPSSSTKFRLALLVLVLASIGASVALARWTLLPWAVDAALKAGGASEVSFDLERATPWRLQIDDLAFRLDAARVAARRASLERRHWWTPSLGRLKVETASVELDLAQTAPAATAPGKAAEPAAPPRLPIEEISVDGQLTLRSGDATGPTLAVDFEARPSAQGDWSGAIRVRAPGLTLAVEAGYGLALAEASFRTTDLQLDLEAARPWLDLWLPPEVGAWEFAGRLTGSVSGRYRADALDATGAVRLRDGRLANAADAIAADGLELDVATFDLGAQQARDVAVRARSVTAGKVILGDVKAGIAAITAKQIDVTSLSAKALGGQLHVEPFQYRPSAPAVDVVVQVENIRAEQVLALTQDLPAQASGPLSGRLPLRYDAGTLRLGTGWLGLAAGQSLEVQLQAEGMLTAGTSPQNTNFAVLKQIEDGLLKLKVTELRLEVRPPGAPANRTAQLHLVGAPVDPRVKAPVTLDLNVNGPIESLLNLGLKTGQGTKP
jgi:hypothetical protein